MPIFNRWKSGVYCILNKINGKRYVGSAVDLNNRRDRHTKALNKSTHSNRHLQAAWNAYGSRSFDFIVIMKCHPDRCIENEQKYIDYYDSSNPNHGYNLSPTAGSTLGVRYSADSRLKLRELRGTPEYKKDQSNRMRARNTQEYIDKLSSSVRASWSKKDRIDKHVEIANTRFHKKVQIIRETVQGELFTRKDIEIAIGFKNAYATVKRMLKEGVITVYDKGRSRYSRPAVYSWATVITEQE